MKRVVVLLTVLIAIQLSAVAQYAKWVVEPIYDQINEFDGNLAAVQRDGKWGYINQKGVEVVACAYENITPFVNGIAIATSSNNQLLAIVYEDGQVIDTFKTQSGERLRLSVDPRYPYFGNDMLLITNGSSGYIKDAKYTKWGYLDKNGILQLPIKYFVAMPFCEGKAGVADEKLKFSYINRRGYEVIPNKALGSRVIAAFGFHDGRALVSEKKKFSYIDGNGNKIEEYEGFQPTELYHEVSSQYVKCGTSRAVIDSLGRINRFIQSNGFVTPVIEQAPPRETLKGDYYFVRDGEKSGDDVAWITTTLAALPYEGKMGIIKAQESPVVELEVAKSVPAILGNVDLLEVRFVNDTGEDINNVVIKCNDDVVERSTISKNDLVVETYITKPTDAEVEIVKERVEITQRGVLLLDKTEDIIVVDTPSITIIGRDDMVYYEENKTVSLSVDIRNDSKYPLVDAILTMNNYQTKISVDPYSTKNCSAFFGVVISEDQIDIEISVKPEKAQPIIKKGTMLLDNLR